MDRGELVRLARMGAAARLEALERERQQILRSFPGLRSSAAPAAQEQAEPSGRGGRRNRREMSAAARKAVSERMTRYWAERRKAKAEGASKSSAAKKK
jgi:hypothetical protein